MSSNHPLVMHRFSNAGDVERLFQAELDKLPRKDGRPVITEFGGVMVGAGDSLVHRLTHIVFPSPMLSVSYGPSSFRGYSPITFPQITLMADTSNNRLYLRLTANRMTSDQIPERCSLILPIGNDCLFNTDIWETFCDQDKEILSRVGFSAGMTNEQWAEAINQYRKSVKPLPHATAKEGKFVLLRELDVLCHRYGVIGTLGSFHFMPEFWTTIQNINRFVYPGEGIPENEEEIQYEIGSAHIHTDFDQLSPEQEYVAAKIGENTVRRCPSIADILAIRGSASLHSTLSRAYRDRGSNTIECFVGILTVNNNGRVTGSRYYDTGLIDSKILIDISDRAEETLKSSSPDYGIILEHYQMVDQISKTNFGTPDSAPYVGALES